MYQPVLRRTADERRLEVRLGANKALLAIIERIQQLYNSFAANSIVAHWELGNLLKQVHDDVDRNSGQTYGGNAFTQVCTYFRGDEGMARNAIRFATEYSKDDIDELCAMRMSNGHPLCFSHALTMLTISDRTERRAILQYALDESWTTADFAREVMKVSAKEKKRTTKRGRPLNVPHNLAGMMRQQRKIAEDFLERANKVWQLRENSLASLTQNVNASKITEELLDRFAAHAKVMEDLAEKAEEMKQEALYTLRALTGRLEQAQKPLKAPECLQRDPSANSAHSISSGKDRGRRQGDVNSLADT